MIARSTFLPRLDRLSALLGGLAPRLRIHHAGPLCVASESGSAAGGELELHLLVRGTLRYGDRFAERSLNAPAALVLRADHPHRLSPDGVEALLLCARVAFEGPAGPLLLQAFEAPMLLGLEAAGDDLDHVLALIRSEIEQPRCGHEALLARAGEILLITILRHVIGRSDARAGVLGALADSRIAAAVVAMHEQPAASWGLEALAERAAMSRTAFAVAFRERMGTTPGSYLSGLRMAIAEKAVEAGAGLKRAAQAAGYASPAALSRALSRRRNEALRSPREADREPQSRAA